MRLKNITQCELNREYLICELQIQKEIQNHLANLNIKAGEKIKVLFKSYFNMSYMVSVLGIMYAIEKNICEKIIVYDA